MAQITNDKCRKRSISTKMLMLMAVALFIFGFTAAAISYKIYLDSSIEQHKYFATGIANLVANEIDPEKVDKYLLEGLDAEGYNDVKNKLYVIRDTSPDIEYIYVYKILEDGCHVVFDLDTDEIKGSSPGKVEQFDESFLPYLPTLLSGGKIDPIISDDTYGWLLTVYVPIYDSKGQCQCYAATDISMNELRHQARDYMIKIAIIFFFIFAVVLLITFQLLKYNLILPINKIAHIAGVFAYDDETSMEKNFEQVKNLKIQTGDEIENLYKAFIKMTEDSVRFTKDVQNKNETIAKM